MNLAERLQGNIMIGHERGILNASALYPHLNKTLLPLFWANKWGGETAAVAGACIVQLAFLGLQ